ncbi:MAG: hypothetical protein J5493_04435 [Lachnospiraceae bacterium]|nr:hypothetical protein [Lachnospiraceae bacterium]
MIWLKELYWGEKAREKGKKLVHAAESGKKGKFDSFYLITLSGYPDGQLDLFKFSDLKSRLFKPEEMVVLGLAGDRAEALGLLEQMANDCLKAGGGVALKAYFAAQPVTAWRGVSV